VVENNFCLRIIKYYVKNCVIDVVSESRQLVGSTQVHFQPTMYFTCVTRKYYFHLEQKQTLSVLGGKITIAYRVVLNVMICSDEPFEICLFFSVSQATDERSSSFHKIAVSVKTTNFNADTERNQTINLLKAIEAINLKTLLIVRYLRLGAC